MIKTRKQLIKAYIDFFKSKGHKEIPNSSLIPENDPTVLFTTAGMHPLVPFLLGQPHPLGKRLCNVQRCIRTGDIDDVGDSFHHTFFEMLGNWSLGDYFKREAIEFSFEFLTKILKIPVEFLAVTCFAGDNRAEKDTESATIWNSFGIPKERIAFLRDDNWWGAGGDSGPCGPCTEMFYWREKTKPPKIFNPNDKNWVEIGNDVLMGYVKEKGKYKQPEQKNIDFGGGVERTLAVLNAFEDNYSTEVWQPIIKKIETVSKKPYLGNERSMRIIADHIKASVFILADGVIPSNIERGYVLRRLIRRAIRHGKILNLKNFIREITEPVFEIYNDYDILKKNKNEILKEFHKEENKFNETLETGIKAFEKLIKNKKELSGKDAFLLYQSYGFPIEITQELAREKNIKVNLEEYEQEYKGHQELSKTAGEGKFRSGLADNSEATTRLHTATHLLNQALKIILKNKNIHQKGSNITPERARFDFNFDRKITKEELKKIENLVNEKIKQALPVEKKEMAIEEAKKLGAEGVFEDKYKDKVYVYLIGDFSKEICAGPHVKNTRELGHFKIIREESIAAGIRRIKAILE